MASGQEVFILWQKKALVCTDSLQNNKFIVLKHTMGLLQPKKEHRVTLTTTLTRRVKFQQRNQKDSSIFHYRFSLCWQQNLSWFSASTNLTYARKRVSFSLHSLRLRFAKRYASSWRVIWLEVLINMASKRKFNFDKNRILLSLHLTIETKVQLILPQAHSGTKMSNACQLSTTFIVSHRHTFPGLMAWNQAQGFQTHPSISVMQRKTCKTFDQLNHRCFLYGEGLISLPQFYNSNEKGKHGCSYCHFIIQEHSQILNNRKKSMSIHGDLTNFDSHLRTPIA